MSVKTNVRLQDSMQMTILQVTYEIICKNSVIFQFFRDDVRNFVKNLYFILIQICSSQLKYITQHVFFKLRKRFCLRSVDAAWSKVFFLRRVRCGIRLRPAGLRRDRVYRQITCMRHRSLNNFHKKWDNNEKKTNSSVRLHVAHGKQ